MFGGSETQATKQPEQIASIRPVWQQAPKDRLLIWTIWSHSPFYKLQHFLCGKMRSSGQMHFTSSLHRVKPRLIMSLSSHNAKRDLHLRGSDVRRMRVWALARFTIMQCERKTTHGKICKLIQNKSSVQWYNAKQLRCESSRCSKDHKRSFCTYIFNLVYTVYKGNKAYTHANDSMVYSLI